MGKWILVVIYFIAMQKKKSTKTHKLLQFYSHYYTQVIELINQTIKIERLQRSLSASHDLRSNLVDFEFCQYSVSGQANFSLIFVVIH